MKAIFLFTLIMIGLNSFSQNENEFVIGAFAYNPKKYFDNECGIETYYSTKYDENGYNTSVLNVYSEDGFTMVQEYAPHEWSILVSEKNRLLCAQANGMKVLYGGGHYYKATNITLYPGDSTGISTGVNEYNNCSNPIDDCTSPKGNGYFRTDMDHYINTVFSQEPFRSIIWGYHMAEEPEHAHPSLTTPDCSCGMGCVWDDPVPPDEYWLGLELPPVNLSLAFHYYNSSLQSLNVSNHKLVLMSAVHTQMINDNTTDPFGLYNTPDYINEIKNISNSVFFEGSYVQFPSTSVPQHPNWNTHVYQDMFSNGFHYLATMKSIDYSKSKMNEVHKVIATYNQGDADGDGLAGDYVEDLETHYHSNLEIKNANWLWFQAYTSIIHGVNGVWFWGNNGSWGDGEYEAWNDNDFENRFHRSYFPQNYLKFTSNLVKELRYLKEKGFLSLDEGKRLYTKLDHEDYYCIVPPADEYIPQNYIDPVTGDNIDLNPIFSTNGDNFRTEEYGLRYTIKTNGNEVVMIITNPLPVTLDNVNLDFSQIPNPEIKDAQGVYVLFETAAGASIPNSSFYKNNRNSFVDWENGTVGNKYLIPFVSHQMNLSFGPMDTKILLFSTDTPIASNPDGEWDKITTNHYTDFLGSWELGIVDKYYQGDFNGNGKEELLIIHTVPTVGSLMSTYEYNDVNDSWDLVWSTSGASHAMWTYRNNLVVGDFDGDGKDDILGIDSWITMFRFINGDFAWSWTDSGNHSISPYKDNMVAGDFDGDGSDEVLGFDFFSGWSTLFHYAGNDFHWGWSNNGQLSDIDPYKQNLVAGDFDGDGQDELLGQASWASVFRLNGTTHQWEWVWTNSGSTSFGGWGFPLAPTDAMLVGDLTSNGKDEVLFIQNGQYANNSRLISLNSNNNSWHTLWTTSINTSPYINDLPIDRETADLSKYFLLKARIDRADHLGCVRRYKMCTNNHKMLESFYYYADDDPVGIEEVKIIDNDFGIIVIPNPSSGLFTINTNLTDVDDAKIYIYSMSGQQIMENKYYHDMEMNLSDYENGIYIIKLIANEKAFFTKIVISK